MGRPELAAQITGLGAEDGEFVALPGDLSGALPRQVLERDDLAGLSAKLDLAPRRYGLDGRQPLLELDLIDRMLRAQCVALGDRLRLGQRRLQSRSRFRQSAGAARHGGRRRQRQQSGDEKADASENRLLDQYRLVPRSKAGRTMAWRRPSSKAPVSIQQYGANNDD